MMVRRDFTNVLDGTKFKRLEMDLRFDTNSARMIGSGDFGDISINYIEGDRNHNFNWVNSQIQILPDYKGDWIHVAITIDPSVENVQQMAGLALQELANDEWSGITGDSTFWVDNIRLIAKNVPVPGQDYLIDSFDTASGTNEVSEWGYWPGWTAVAEDFEFDPNLDAGGATNTSGSMKITAHFNWTYWSTNESWHNQMMVRRNLDDVIDGTQFERLEIDLRFDTNSAKRIGPGDFGDIYINYVEGFNSRDFNWTNSHVQIPADYQGEWIHLAIPIDPAGANVGQMVGLALKEWAGDNWNGITGDSTFWVDNVKLIAKIAPASAPVLSLERVARTGLKVFASHPTERWQRQGIRTSATNYSWVEVTSPVTYSVSITDFPTPDPTPDPADVRNGHVYIFLVPEGGGTNLPYGPDDIGVDWDAADMAFFRLQYETVTNQHESLGVGYIARFAWKTNQPGSQALMFPDQTNPPPVGMLAAVKSPTPLGTWSVTISDVTNVTLSGPGGIHTSGALPADAGARFAGPLYAYFGYQPNNTNNIGSSVTINQIEIAGIEPPVFETFPNSTLGFDWIIVASDPNGLVSVSPDSAWWLTWTLPDVGFGLQASTNLAAADAWEDLLLPTRQLLGKRMVLVPDGVPGSGGFFRLLKP
jgi:hypothetical protein